MNKSAKRWLVAGIIILAVLLDQIVKIYIKLHFRLGEAHEIFPWFQILFVENDGMAFGIEWFSKYFLTGFRIIFIGVIAYYIHLIIKNSDSRKVRLGYLIAVSFVCAGAIGNIIDCLFYGVCFSESTLFDVATFMPTEGGYAPLFCGKVVDMLYFPLIRNSVGETIFFQPVFNIADSCITVAVLVILFFYSKDLNSSLGRQTAEQKGKNEDK